jgi:hypothetical protein
MASSKKLWMLFFMSLLIAFFSWIAPADQMPLDYRAMIWRSIPFASAWLLVVMYALRRYKCLGLVLLLGAPIALYWPIWLMFNHFPPCYYAGNCQ